MFSLSLKMSFWKNVNQLNSYVKIFNKNVSFFNKALTDRLPAMKFEFSKSNELHTSGAQRDLMEFFDKKENWSEFEVRVGRSWRLEELRIKSNSDLHKLWYVLLKERNMLLTMQHECYRQERNMPNPERLDKVEESMENLETVVRERNRAYFELETGETGERPMGKKTDCFGLEYVYKMREHVLEKKFNKTFLENEKLFNHTDDHKFVNNFLRRLEEKKRRIQFHNNRRRHLAACELLKVFPNVDEEALKEQFPDVDIEAVKKDKESRGHQENAI